MHYTRVSLYAFMLATAGIPLYIHLPRFASVQLDIGLATLGGLLLLIRVFDFVQDPLLGWLVDRFPKAQAAFAFSAAGGLALGFPLLFSLGPGEIWKLIILLMLLFTSYSLGTILIYGRSEILSRSRAPSELLKLASWREAGQLCGVIIAAATPTLFTLMFGAEKTWSAFGLFLGAVALAAAIVTRPLWWGIPRSTKQLSFLRLSESGALRLLMLALLNSLPVALTSTLFLFFAEDHLGLSNRAGLFLLVFFLAAGVSIPIWSLISNHIGPRKTLICAMALAVIAFAGAAFLAPQNATGFLLICIGSGFAIGADILILPLLFSTTLIRAGLNASSAFGIWSLAGKISLALAAATALPLLESFDFTPGAPMTPMARSALVMAYAIAPCVLKAIALCFTLTLPKEEPET